MVSKALRPTGALYWLTAGLLIAACGDDGGGEVPGGADGGVLEDLPVLSVAGSVIDFRTSEVLTDTAIITVEGLVPAPAVAVKGDIFTIGNIPPSSVFHLLTSREPDYRATYGSAVEVDASNVTGLVLEAMSEDYISALASAFNVTPAAGTSILVVRALGEDGMPLADISASIFRINDQMPVSGPFFLNANRDPDARLRATSASGVAVFFDVAPGTATVNAAQNSGYTMRMPVSPVAAATVTIADLEVVEGETMLPQNVSFSQQVMPIFERRSCTGCHAGGGIGRELGNLSLQGSASLMHRELTEEISPRFNTIRINRQMPDQSIALTMPGFQPDTHPNTTFASDRDPDYVLIKIWIAEGALNN